MHSCLESCSAVIYDGFLHLAKILTKTTTTVFSIRQVYENKRTPFVNSNWNQAKILGRKVTYSFQTSGFGQPTRC